MSQPNAAPATQTAASPEKPATNFRWVILGLLFFATTVNYLDRTVLSVLAPYLQKQYSITDAQYGDINSAFALAYAFGQLISGAILDIIGVRLGFALALVAWSAAAISHAFAQGAFGFKLARTFLGVAESPNFPACTKTISEWFPRKERAFVFGFVNAGTNMGALLAPVAVPWLARKFGWQAAFICTGAIGLIWLGFWLPLYTSPSKQPKVSPSELAYIQSDPPEHTTKIPWIKFEKVCGVKILPYVPLLAYRGAWAFALGKFLTDSMWWFYVAWFPKFLHDKYGFDLLTIGTPLIVIYVMADLGSIAGGWLSSTMIKRGATVNRARKTAFLACSIAILPVMFAQSISQVWLAVLVMGLATAAHQGFSSNLYTLVSDVFPRQTVASVAGLGGTAGYIGVALFQAAVGRIVQTTGSYQWPFVIAASAYLVATFVIHVFVPRINPPAQTAT